MWLVWLFANEFKQLSVAKAVATVTPVVTILNCRVFFLAIGATLATMTVVIVSFRRCHCRTTPGGARTRCA